VREAMLRKHGWKCNTINKIQFIVIGDIDMQLIRENFILGNIYRTVGGDLVKLVKVSNEGTSYETMACAKGIHRYTQRDYGRVTATDSKKPDSNNLIPLYRVVADHYDVPHRWSDEIERDDKENEAKRLHQKLFMIDHVNEWGKACPKSLKDEVRKIKKELPNWKTLMIDWVKNKVA
jgi:hypothetical protein